MTIGAFVPLWFACVLVATGLSLVCLWIATRSAWRLRHDGPEGYVARVFAWQEVVKLGMHIASLYVLIAVMLYLREHSQLRHAPLDRSTAVLVLTVPVGLGIKSTLLLVGHVRLRQMLHPGDAAVAERPEGMIG